MKRLFKFFLYFVLLLFILAGAGLIIIQKQVFQLTEWDDSETEEKIDPRGRPNILLLVAEDMSPKVGMFGDSLAHTPNIDRLAKMGIRYPNTFTTAGVCAPSRAALITGMHQISMGAQHMRTSTRPEGAYKAVPPPFVKAFPELMRQEGYFTFNTVKQDYQFSGTLPGSGPFTIWDEENNANLWRNRETNQPFFGMMNFMETHESKLFTPLGSHPNNGMHFLMQVLGYVSAPDDIEPVSVDPDLIDLPPYYPDHDAVRRDLAQHYKNISIMDALIGKMLDKLEKDGLMENTIIIWTTDHGDGLPRAKRELYDSGIKVPMTIYYPPAFRPADMEPGTVDERLISFVDLAPTILSFAKINVPKFMQGQGFLASDSNRAYIFASRDRIDEVNDRQRAIRNHRYKYIKSWYPEQEGGHHMAFRDNLEMMQALWRLKDQNKLNDDQLLWFQAPGEERLFDLREDPFELNDLSKDSSYTQVLDTMRWALHDWLNSREDWSEQPENEMVDQFQFNGETRITPNPEFELTNNRLKIKAENGASIGYQFGDGRWQVYADPIDMSIIEEPIKAKAIRYGWEESDVVVFEKVIEAL